MLIFSTEYVSNFLISPDSGSFETGFPLPLGVFQASACVRGFFMYQVFQAPGMRFFPQMLPA